VPLLFDLAQGTHLTFCTIYVKFPLGRA
jgi:hypothetical protein